MSSSADSRRSKRRHDTRVKQARRKKLWDAVHHYNRPGPYPAHKVKFWPMRCRCDWCVQSRRRDLRTPSASPESADHEPRRG